MATCTPCIVSNCITAPVNCRTGAPGGWQKLWFANLCEVETLGFETVLNEPRGRVNSFALAGGSTLKSFGFYKKSGLQLNSEGTDENGFRITHTAIVPVVNRDAETLATIREMVGAELVLIGLHRDGRYYIAGIGDEGFELTTWNDAKGRLAADGAVMELTFTLTDIYPQVEFLLNEPGTDPADLVARAAYTRSQLQSLEDCSPSGGLPDAVGFSVLPITLTLSAGDSGPYSIAAEIQRLGYTGTLSFGITMSTLPAGIVPTLPPDLTTESFAEIVLTADGTQAPGSYSIVFSVGGEGLNASEATVFVNVS